MGASWGSDNAHYCLLLSGEGIPSVAEDAENFRCGGGLLDYVQILYGNKGSQQKYGLEVPQMKKNT